MHMVATRTWTLEELHSLPDDGNRYELINGELYVVQVSGSEVEPDLMVRAVHPNPDGGWGTAPLPILIVEILSPTTARRDRTVKREHYRDIGIAEYWIADPDALTITVLQRGTQVAVESGMVIWAPVEARNHLRIDVRAVFAGD
jgi:Uma2 family endonuclease